MRRAGIVRKYRVSFGISVSHSPHSNPETLKASMWDGGPSDRHPIVSHLSACGIHAIIR